MSSRDAAAAPWDPPALAACSLALRFVVVVVVVPISHFVVCISYFVFSCLAAIFFSNWFYSWLCVFFFQFFFSQFLSTFQFWLRWSIHCAVNKWLPCIPCNLFMHIYTWIKIPKMHIPLFKLLLLVFIYFIFLFFCFLFILILIYVYSYWFNIIISPKIKQNVYLIYLPYTIYTPYNGNHYGWSAAARALAVALAAADLWICSIYETICSHCSCHAHLSELTARCTVPPPDVGQRTWHCGMHPMMTGNLSGRPERMRDAATVASKDLTNCTAKIGARERQVEAERKRVRAGDKQLAGLVIRIFLTATWLHFNARHKINNNRNNNKTTTKTANS